MSSEVSRVEYSQVGGRIGRLEQIPHLWVALALLPLLFGMYLIVRQEWVQTMVVGDFGAIMMALKVKD